MWMVNMNDKEHSLYNLYVIDLVLENDTRYK